jgi:hypothetical protein
LVIAAIGHVVIDRVELAVVVPAFDADPVVFEFFVELFFQEQVLGDAEGVGAGDPSVGEFLFVCFVGLCFVVVELLIGRIRAVRGVGVLFIGLRGVELIAVELRGLLVELLLSRIGGIAGCLGLGVGAGGEGERGGEEQTEEAQCWAQGQGRA